MVIGRVVGQQMNLETERDLLESMLKIERVVLLDDWLRVGNVFPFTPFERCTEEVHWVALHKMLVIQIPEIKEDLCRRHPKAKWWPHPINSTKKKIRKKKDKIYRNTNTEISLD